MRDRLVLCYHAVSPDWPATLAISPERLREQVGFLLGRGYEAATFAELVRGEGSDRALAVTFDDGYRSVLELGLPVLSELGVPATIFVPTDFVGSPAPMRWPGIDHWSPGPHEAELRCLNWEQLRRLHEAGWEVGSHSRSHPRLTELDDQSLAAELTDSREACERELGVPCMTLAYPYGDNDPRVQRAAREAGYEAAASLSPGMERAYCWPRVGVYPVDEMRRFRIKTASAVRRFRAAGPVQVIERARQ